MITCKDFQIELCNHCASLRIGPDSICFIEGYKNDIAFCKSFTDVINQYKNICEFQKYYKYDNHHSIIYYEMALERYFPWWHKKLEKLLVLI